MTYEEAASQPPPNAHNNVTNNCLDDRKYWCFLLSSICTFLAGLLIVLVWRLFAFICCRKEADLGPNDPKQKEQKAARQGKQEFEGTFMTEAKDWAGELISGQTTTGRILVICTLIEPAVLVQGKNHFLNRKEKADLGLPSVNPSKTEMVPFTRKRRLQEQIKEPTLLSTKLNFASEIEYPGTTFYDKLT
ncbi:hypothetical protein NQ317_013765 [Molorchus minor]|uniref:Calcium-activated potassium channel slowpoke n=1 Tax=Molorchus minor TaxID=1323400 RepID=A0ABQ9JRR7_9CUCU|nr:hypothetical protein NQ317_013765 [Molorchus minor]